MGIEELYNESVKFLQVLLHRDPLRHYIRMRFISPEQRDTPRLRDSWLDFTEDTLYFHLNLTIIKDIKIEQAFCHFAAFCAFFPIDYWQNDVIFTGIWLWHMSKLISCPRLSPLILNITARFSTYMDHTAVHKNALTLLSFLDLDQFYEIVGCHLLPFVNPLLPETMLIRLFSQITMYLISRSLRLQDLISFCQMSPFNFVVGRRYMINYSKCGLLYFFGILFWNERSKATQHRHIHRYLCSHYFISNLNICQSMITFYALLPPHRQTEFENYLKQLQRAHYLHSWSLTLVHISKTIHYDRAVSTPTKLAPLMEFGSQRLFTLRRPILNTFEIRVILQAEYPCEITSVSLDEIRITFLYDILHASCTHNEDLPLIYTFYTRIILNPLPFADFALLWKNVVTKNLVVEDRSSIIFTMRQSPTVLIIGLLFPFQPSFLQIYASMYTTLAPNDNVTADFGLLMTVSTFFFPFWCKQCYWCGCGFFLYDIEYLKLTDVVELASHISDLFGSIPLPFPETIPDNSDEETFFPSSPAQQILQFPPEMPSPEKILPDFLVMRRLYFVHDSLYEFTFMQQDKLAHLFTTLFTSFFDLHSIYNRIDTVLVRDVKQAIGTLKMRRSHDSKFFLALCTPFHRIFPAVLHNLRIQVILTAHCMLNPILCATNPILQGLFQWGLLSCTYQTTAALSLVILEYEIPQSIYDNPRSEFHRFWTECKQQYKADLQITILPIDSCWYACNLSTFTSYNLLALSLVNLKRMKECDDYLNPHLLNYEYTVLPPNSECISSNPLSYLELPDESGSRPIWWREWLSSSFFIATQGTLRVLIIISKDEVWFRQKDRLLNFFQQFPGMWINDTHTYWIVRVDLGGFVREAVAFLTAQLLANQLNYELCFPIDLTYNPPDLIRDFMQLSRQPYHGWTSDGDVIEEPLFCYKSRHILYPLAFRVRVHTILSELLRTHHETVKTSLWGEIVPLIDRCYQHMTETGEFDEATFKSVMETVLR